jgi:hypothetical protein
MPLLPISEPAPKMPALWNFAFQTPERIPKSEYLSGSTNNFIFPDLAKNGSFMGEHQLR